MSAAVRAARRRLAVAVLWAADGMTTSLIGTALALRWRADAIARRIAPEMAEDRT